MTEITYKILLPQPIQFTDFPMGFFIIHPDINGPLYYKPFGLSGACNLETNEYLMRNDDVWIIPVRVKIDVIEPLSYDVGADVDDPGY